MESVIMRQTDLDRDQMLRYTEYTYIRKLENILMTGSTGIRESAYLQHLGVRACTLGFKVYCHANM
ncbi:MAG: hypothetical protein IPJ16_02005 [Bacteroidales bacterium]|nr:hypothetical protein [Bacteroidales bacterium]